MVGANMILHYARRINALVNWRAMTAANVAASPSWSPASSAGAKITIEALKLVPLRGIGGEVLADIGYASQIAVGNAEAQGVSVAVIRGSTDLFGQHLDGLLGMSVLARFNGWFTLPRSSDKTVLNRV